MLSLKERLIKALQSNLKFKPKNSPKIKQWIVLIKELTIPNNSYPEIFILILFGILIPHSFNVMQEKKLKKFKLDFLRKAGLEELIKLDLDCLIGNRLTSSTKEDALAVLSEAITDYYYKVGINPQQKELTNLTTSLLDLAMTVYGDLDRVLQKGYQQKR